MMARVLYALLRRRLALPDCRFTVKFLAGP